MVAAEVVAGVTLKPLRLGATKAAMVDAAEAYDVRGARLGLEPVVKFESLGCFSRRKQGNKMMTSASPKSPRWKHVGFFFLEMSMFRLEFDIKIIKRKLPGGIGGLGSYRR